MGATPFPPDSLKSDEVLDRFKVLVDMRERQTRAITAMSRSLRLTQQSRYRPGPAARLADNSTEHEPWQ